MRRQRISTMRNETDVLQQLLSEGEGKRVAFIGRAADMISINLYSERWEYGIDIHIMGEADFSCDHRFILRSEDMFRSFGNKDGLLYDRTIPPLFHEDCVLEKLKIDRESRLHLEFSNHIELVTRISNEKADDFEIWRLFFPWTTMPHIVCYSNNIEIESETCSELEIQERRERFLKRMEERTAMLQEKAVPKYYYGKEVQKTISAIVKNAFVYPTQRQRINRIHKELIEAFHIERRMHPHWVHGGEWPMGTKTPMKYIKSESMENGKRFIFIDVDNREKKVVYQND